MIKKLLLSSPALLPTCLTCYMKATTKVQDGARRLRPEHHLFMPVKLHCGLFNNI
jgi:hypothetical protein